MRLFEEFFDRLRAKNPGLDVDAVSTAFARIAKEKRYRLGTGSGSIYNLRNDERFEHHSKFRMYREIMEVYAREVDVDVTDIFNKAERQTDVATSVDKALIGVWQLLMYSPTSHAEGDTRPSPLVRRSLVRFFPRDRIVEMLGVSTKRKGNFSIRRRFTIITSWESTEDMEWFGVFEEPSREYNVPPIHVPATQRGISLSVALGRFDDPRPIVAGRCVLRKLRYLSEFVGRLESRWNDSLRSDYCGYDTVRQLKQLQRSYDNFMALKEGDRIVAEQYWDCLKMITLLEEEKGKGNFGNRIYLR